MSRTRKHKVDENGRECSKCDTYKVWDEFYANSTTKNGKDTRCKECMRAKTRGRNKLADVQEAERLRWIQLWQAAHPGEIYERRRVRQRDEYGQECAYEGEGNCGHMFKPWDEFSTNKQEKRETRCRACMASRSLFQSFSITYADLLLLRQSAVFGEGLCDIHGGPETMKYARWEGSEGVRSLSVDHDHSCDQGHPPEKGCRYCIRGLLCCQCNRNVVRMAEEWPAVAARFKDYLERRPLL